MTALDIDADSQKVLDTFPGIWVLFDGTRIVSASRNYYEKARGNWQTLAVKKLPNGLVVHWMVRPQ